MTLVHLPPHKRVCVLHMYYIITEVCVTLPQQFHFPSRPLVNLAPTAPPIPRPSSPSRSRIPPLQTWRFSCTCSPRSCALWTAITAMSMSWDSTKAIRFMIRMRYVTVSMTVTTWEHQHVKDIHRQGWDRRIRGSGRQATLT